MVNVGAGNTHLPTFKDTPERGFFREVYRYLSISSEKGKEKKLLDVGQRKYICKLYLALGCLL